MIVRRPSETHRAEPAEPAALPPAVPRRGPTPREPGRPATAPRSREEAEAQFVAARDAWTDAMRRASSGRSADLASLAIAQEAYEVASAQREGWLAGGQTAIPITPGTSRRPIDVFLQQDLAWQRVRDAERRRPTLLARVARLARRITGRR